MCNSNNPTEIEIDVEKLMKKNVKNVESYRLVAKYRNDDETEDYIKGYKDGYNKAINNILNSLKTI